MTSYEDTHEDTYEVGAIANFMIGRAKKNKRPLTHFKLQSLVYYAYGICLADQDRRLFKQHIEAWPVGPVVPELYHEFKRFGIVPVRDWSTDFNYETRKVTFPAVDDSDQLAIYALNVTWTFLGDYSEMDLRKRTHRPNGPWDRAKSEQRRTIPDEWIREEADTFLNHVTERILTDRWDG